MKTIITAIIILAAITLVVVYASQNPVITEVVVLRDITDNHLAQPDIDEILSLYNMENKWNGGIFHFINLTNVSYNQKAEVKLKARNEWFSNELDRNKEIKEFKNEVSKIIIGNEKEAIGKDNSSVYTPIAMELNRLHESTASKKIVLMYSDMMENTNEMSFYDKQKMEFLKTNPDTISKYYERLVPLKSLYGIHIYIIFQPHEIKENEQFKIVSEFYKRLFEFKGAIVDVVANLN